MAGVVTKAFKGTVRLHLAGAAKRMQALVAYNTKSPLRGLLSPAELTAVAATQAILAAKLAATRVR